MKQIKITQGSTMELNVLENQELQLVKKKENQHCRNYYHSASQRIGTRKLILVLREGN